VNWTKIKYLINAASPRSAIIVAAGVYNENLVIDKPISLVGEDKEKTIIIGLGIGNVVYIASDRVTVSGFTIKRSGTNHIGPFNGGDAGVMLDKCRNCTLSNLIVTENSLGIFLNLSDSNIVENNIVYLNRKDGIYLRLSNNNIIRGNNCTLNGGHGGIYLNPSSNNNLIENNICDWNADHGIKLQKSSNYNVLINNTCLNNRVRGILLWSTSNNAIINNTISLNGNGIYIDNSSHNKIYYNTISKNWRGISIIGGNSIKNEIHQNNIVGNIEWGLLNEAPIEVNATLNWWGSPYGPEVCQFVEDTDEEDPEEIRGKILYEPWLKEPWPPRPPQIKIAYPQNGSFISNIVRVEVNASDPSGVDRVEFYINQTLVYVDDEPPYQWSWNTIQFNDGTYIIKVTAYDAMWRISASHTTTVIIDNKPPSAKIIEPHEGTILAGVINIIVSGSDINLKSIRLYINKILVVTWNMTGQYTYRWNTTKYLDGNYTLKLVAYDKAGNSVKN